MCKYKKEIKTILLDETIRGWTGTLIKSSEKRESFAVVITNLR